MPFGKQLAFDSLENSPFMGLCLMYNYQGIPKIDNLIFTLIFLNFMFAIICNNMLDKFKYRVSVM